MEISTKVLRKKHNFRNQININYELRIKRNTYSQRGVNDFQK